jgi:hypothetical protein
MIMNKRQTTNGESLAWSEAAFCALVALPRNDARWLRIHCSTVSGLSAAALPPPARRFRRRFVARLCEASKSETDAPSDPPVRFMPYKALSQFTPVHDEQERSTKYVPFRSLRRVNKRRANGLTNYQQYGRTDGHKTKQKKFFCV